jgi:hypothetical protein
MFADVILLDNFDPNYLVFERAGQLQRNGRAKSVLVPIRESTESQLPNSISHGIAELMARRARLNPWEIVAIPEKEPISLNAAVRIRDRLRHDGVKSVIVVSPGFRSYRSWLVYHAVLDAEGVGVDCVPVFGSRTPRRWTTTWHGIQEVASELLKLQYYACCVLPFQTLRDTPR